MYEFNSFLKYKEWKKFYDFSYKGYKIDKLMAVHYFLFRDNHSIDKIKTWRSAFQLSRRITSYIAYSGLLKEKVISLFMPERKDYVKLVDGVCEKGEFDFRLDYSLNSIMWVPLFSARVYFNFYKAWRIINQASLDARAKLYFTMILSRIFNTIDELEKCNFETVKQFVAFNSSAWDDAYLVQYFNKRGVPTFSLQHGVYFEFRRNTPVDVVNFENVTAKTFLAWGEQTASIVKKHSPHVITKVVGHPYIVSSLDILETSNTLKSCLVFLPRRIYHKDNLELLGQLNVVRNNGIKVFVKLHPSLTIELWQVYVKKCEEHQLELVTDASTVSEIVSQPKYHFFIAYNTTCYYECMSMGKICLRYKPGENEIMSNLDDEFSSGEEILNLIHKIQSSKLEYQKSMSKQYNFVFSEIGTVEKSVNL